MKSQRQTDLKLDQILKLLKEKDRTYPGCMLLNEIGIMCIEQKDEKSEKSLLSFLDSPVPSFRAISFCYLSSVKELQEKNKLVLAKFQTNPANEMLLEDIDIMLEKFKKDFA